MVTKVDWAELGNNVDGTTVFEPAHEVFTKYDWVVVGNYFEKLGYDDKGLLEITKYKFS